MTVPIVRKLFSIDEYHAMIQSGILTKDDRVELIEGEILEMAPIGSRHSGCVKRLNQLFSENLRRRVIVGVQDPVYLNDLSEPQPDLSILLPRDDYYSQSHPRPDDVLLIVEVADSTVAYDRHLKIPLYARNRIPEVWLVDLDRSVVETHRDAVAGTYRTVQTFQRGDRLSPQAFPDISLTVDEILG